LGYLQIKCSFLNWRIEARYFNEGDKVLERDYIILIICISWFMVSISGCVSGEQSTKHYNSNGVSFDYPASWKEMNDQFPDEIETESKILVRIVDAGNVNAEFCIEKHPLSTGENLESLHNMSLDAIKRADYQLLDSKETEIDGVKAYEVNFKADVRHVHLQQKEIWCVYNDSVYTLSCSAAPEEFGWYQKDFNGILQSFKFN